MYSFLRKTFENIYNDCQEKKLLSKGDIPVFTIEVPPNRDMGDYSSNIAMLLAKRERKAPRAIAKTIVDAFSPLPDAVKKVEIAGPGFINVFLSDQYYANLLEKIKKEGDNYGRLNFGKKAPVQVEFVSANPTGPLHVGHGRGAVVGDVLSRLLSWAGYDVKKEYFVNDAGKQVLTLGRSLYARYKQAFGEDAPFPEDGYFGGYVVDMAKSIKEEHGEHFLDMTEEEAVPELAKLGVSICLKKIETDLADFGIVFDNWVSEQSLFEKNLVTEAIAELKDSGCVYKDKDAWWLSSSRFGDDKDRVVIRANGEPTYFASDIAYHKDKVKRGFSKIINVWGADHHGYIPRVRAALSSMGFEKSILEVLLVQLVTLTRNGEIVPMSKRQGAFTTLSEVVNEVGKDAARFFFLMRRCDSQLDFDLELAKKQSSENPVYYVQYAHARISSILRDAKADLNNLPPANLSILSSDEDRSLIKILGEFPRLVENSARKREAHRIAFYLQDVAGEFHKYYNKHRILGLDSKTTDARIALIASVRQVLRNGFDIIGITPLESM